MATLVKAQIAERLYLRNPALSQKEAKKFVEVFFEALKDVIVENDEPLKLSGFGNFKKLDKTSRPGRNPKTNQPHIISARRVCTFAPGAKLRARCENIDRYNI